MAERQAADLAISTVSPPSSTPGIRARSPNCPGLPNGPTPVPSCLSPLLQVCPSILDRLAPRSDILRVLDSWFNEVHALAPILCRRHFLCRLDSDEADRNPVFCGLVASVCAATVATLPRGGHGSVTIQGCRDFIQEHQLLAVDFSSYYYTVDWCIAMYNVATSLLALPRESQSEMAGFHVWSQAAAGVRYLTYYCMSELSLMEKELLKRLYWLLFVSFA